MAIAKRGKAYRYNFMWRGKKIQRSTKLVDPVKARRAEYRHRELLAMVAAELPEAPGVAGRARGRTLRP